MKNKAILKRKCMEIPLYTLNIIHLGKDVMFTNACERFYFVSGLFISSSSL